MNRSIQLRLRKQYINLVKNSFLTIVRKENPRFITLTDLVHPVLIN